MRHRRLVRDYEASSARAEAFVLLAMIRIQIRRIADCWLFRIFKQAPSK